MASNPFLSTRPVSSLLPPPTSPRLLRGAPASLCPTSAVSAPTAGWAGGGAGEAQAPVRAWRRHLSGPPVPAVPVLKAAPAAPQSVTTRAGMCPPASRGVSVPHLAAGLSFPLCPPALQSCPHSCSPEQKQPLVFPSTASLHPAYCSRSLPGSLWGVRFVWGSSVPLSRMACDAAGPSLGSRL